MISTRLSRTIAPFLLGLLLVMGSTLLIASSASARACTGCCNPGLVCGMAEWKCAVAYPPLEHPEDFACDGGDHGEPCTETYYCGS
jgi:hypothetical protein